jgi:hypothetical protein
MVTPSAGSCLCRVGAGAGSSTTTSSRARSRTRSARSQDFSICACPCACDSAGQHGSFWRRGSLRRCSSAVRMVTPSAGSCLCRRVGAGAGTSTSTSSRAQSQSRLATSQAFSICARPCACESAAQHGSFWRRCLLPRCSCLCRIGAGPRRHLGSNQLTGPIPDSLGSLSSLVYLCVPVRMR